MFGYNLIIALDTHFQKTIESNLPIRLYYFSPFTSTKRCVSSVCHFLSNQLCDFPMPVFLRTMSSLIPPHSTLPFRIYVDRCSCVHVDMSKRPELAASYMLQNVRQFRCLREDHARLTEGRLAPKVLLRKRREHREHRDIAGGGITLPAAAPVPIIIRTYLYSLFDKQQPR